MPEREQVKGNLSVSESFVVGVIETRVKKESPESLRPALYTLLFTFYTRLEPNQLYRSGIIFWSKRVEPERSCA